MKSISTSFFNVPTLTTSAAVGDLLIAGPFLKDKWFGRSVISVIDHDDHEGTTGVVLNMQLATELSEVFKDVEKKDIPVFCGGPLGHDRLFFLHTLGDEIIPDSKLISPGLWLGGQFASAVEYVNSGYPVEGSIRFFIGYSGWSPGQLGEELAANTWAVSPDKIAGAELLSGEGGAYWHKIVKSLGERYKKWQLLPADFRAN